MFFDLHHSGRLSGHGAILIDSNADLIGLYEIVRDAPDAVLAELDLLAEGYALDGRSHYYTVRDQHFNPLREARRHPSGRIAYTPALAAMFIYLNRTGFNGLFRVNASGEFNVPHGRYDRPRIVDREKLAQVTAALNGPGVELVWGTYESAREIAEPGDFLYFDPPYAPLTRTANFNQYTPDRFTMDDQARLQHLVVELAARGCHVVVSNSPTDEITELYERDSAAIDAGLRTYRVPARRAVNRDAGSRGPIEELMIANAVLD